MACKVKWCVDLLTAKDSIGIIMTGVMHMFVLLNRIDKKSCAEEKRKDSGGNVNE